MNAFETVSFHIIKPCNMKCKFCYATFEDMHIINQMSKQDAFTVIQKLAEAGVQKITFAGGEPMLYRHLDSCIKYSKEIGMTTSLITNGSFISEAWLTEMENHLDWIGLSVDSLDEATNALIGRQYKFKVDYRSLVTAINSHGYKLKINTVVNAYNKWENMNEFITFANPERWKVFQALRVEGQNDTQFEEVRVWPNEFEYFLRRHLHQPSLVPEDNQAMTGSYLLVDPQGRLFENSAGHHTYSESLIYRDMETCLEQINLNREMFVKRGGIYNW